MVLNEHFRCASEIIAFSNRQFYDDHLITLRMPMKSERISPSILDVRVRDGAKVGKVNEKEADEIVKRVQEVVANSSPSNPRSIGIISLIGAEQSQLIRGRLLDVIGPHSMARHNVLVGDPPTFQGAERDSKFRMTCAVFPVRVSPRSHTPFSRFVVSYLSLNGLFTWERTDTEPIDALSESKCGNVKS